MATQAGKGLFRRQEIQDLIALTRVLADRRDTLALGALLRGPLVGLTEEELLDIVWALPRPGDDELGHAFATLVVAPPNDEWQAWYEELVTQNRATALTSASRRFWTPSKEERSRWPRAVYWPVVVSSAVL